MEAQVCRKTVQLFVQVTINNTANNKKKDYELPTSHFSRQH